MFSLVGILIIVIGFMLKIDTLAIVVIAGIVTGFVGGFDFRTSLCIEPFYDVIRYHITSYWVNGTLRFKRARRLVNWSN